MLYSNIYHNYKSIPIYSMYMPTISGVNKVLSKKYRLFLKTKDYVKRQQDEILAKIKTKIISHKTYISLPSGEVPFLHYIHSLRITEVSGDLYIMDIENQSFKLDDIVMLLSKANTITIQQLWNL